MNTVAHSAIETKGLKPWQCIALLNGLNNNTINTENIDKISILVLNHSNEKEFLNSLNETPKEAQDYSSQHFPP